MNKLMVSVRFMLLVGCSFDMSANSLYEINSNVPYTLPRSGTQVATDLREQYYNEAINCGSNSTPAFLCSGVDIRGTGSGQGYDTWNPSETAVQVGGISFSYLRTDYKMKRLAYNYTHGFIFYPMLRRPAGKIAVEVLCFFPIDGQSNYRAEGGCGASADRPNSDMCHRVGVETGAQWSAHYNTFGEYPSGVGSCAMDTRDSSNAHAGVNFQEGLVGGRNISPKPFEKPNDLKHKVWAQDIASVLPIQAFFYLNAQGLVLAQNDQRRFCEVTGDFMPIIRLTLPQTLQQEAAFDFSSSDQLSVCGGSRGI